MVAKPGLAVSASTSFGDFEVVGATAGDRTTAAQTTGSWWLISEAVGRWEHLVRKLQRIRKFQRFFAQLGQHLQGFGKDTRERLIAQ